MYHSAVKNLEASSGAGAGLKLDLGENAKGRGSGHFWPGHE